MNPEEGGLRPQLLDRFGLMAGVEAETNKDRRQAILETVLRFDQALEREKASSPDPFIEQGREQARRLGEEIKQAKERFKTVELTPQVAATSVRLATEFEVEGHRSDYLLALAACAYAARLNQPVPTLDHLRMVAELVLRHRLPGANQFNNGLWGEEQEYRLIELLEDV
jgi:magnesium chelatase subunit I